MGYSMILKVSHHVIRTVDWWREIYRRRYGTSIYSTVMRQGPLQSVQWYCTLVLGNSSQYVGIHGAEGSVALAANVVA